MVNNADKLYKAYLGELKEQVCLQIICKKREKIMLGGAKCYYPVQILCFFSDSVMNKYSQLNTDC